MRLLKISVTHIIKFLLFELPASDQVLPLLQFLTYHCMVSSKTCLCHFRFARVHYRSSMCQKWPESSSCGLVSSPGISLPELNWCRAFCGSGSVGCRAPVSSSGTKQCYVSVSALFWGCYFHQWSRQFLEAGSGIWNMMLWWRMLWWLLLCSRQEWLQVWCPWFSLLTVIIQSLGENDLCYLSFLFS